MRRVLTIAGFVTSLLAGFVVPAGAGEDPFQVLNVTKVVEGSPPAGAEFVVEVECSNDQGPTESDTLTFDGSGTQVFDAGGASTECTATETESAGATTVTYSCEEVSAAQCDAAGNAVTFTSDVAEATITVTNTFTPAPPPPPPPSPEPALPPAPVLAARPVFTG
jgi:hypothetical protein